MRLTNTSRPPLLTAARAGYHTSRMEHQSQIVDRPGGLGTQAIDRAGLLLGLVLDSPEPLAVGQLADRAGLPKSTTSRLLGSLARHGLVRRDGARGKVGPGTAILRFAHRGAAARDLVELADASLLALSEASGETINLAVPGAGGVEHIAQVDSVHFLGAGHWVGRTVAYMKTAVGKVLVAHGAAQPGHPLDARRRAELQRCRREGYAVAVDELEPGLTAIAAPVHGPSGEVIAALAISGPSLRLSARRLAELRPTLIMQARALSARLGHTHPDGRTMTQKEGDQAA